MNMKYEELLFLCITFFVGSMVAGIIGLVIWHISLGNALLMLVSVHLDYGFVLLIQVDILFYTASGLVGVYYLIWA